MERDLTTDAAEARRRFDVECAALRPDLLRFCARMTGSPWDGDDVLQDALAVAFYRLGELERRESLRSWLFRICHNKCIDFLRSRRRVEPMDEEHAAPAAGADEALDGRFRTAHVIEAIVTELAPKERACVILKDVLECSLEEVASITGSTVGSVKIALSRGRGKLAERERERATRVHRFTPQRRALVDRYVEAFNARDWPQVRALLADEARLEVVGRAEGPFTDDRYFVNYGRIPEAWQLRVAVVDGEEIVVHYRHVDGVFRPHSVVKLWFAGDRLTCVRDYLHSEGLLRHSVIETPE